MGHEKKQNICALYIANLDQHHYVTDLKTKTNLITYILTQFNSHQKPEVNF